LEEFQLLLESCTVLVGYKVLIHPKKKEKEKRSGIGGEISCPNIVTPKN
jgi:hypothetical protein